MRYLSPTTAWMLAVTLVSWSFAQDVPGPEQAATALTQAWVEGWNNGNLDSVAALYTEDADLLGSTGEMVEGREAIESYLNELSSGPLSGTTISVGEAEVRCFSDSTCVSDSSYEFSGDSTLSGLTTIVLVKQNDEWRIAAHRSRVPVTQEQ